MIGRHVILLVALLISGSIGAAQVDLPHALVKSSRVIVLPFANFTDAPDLRESIVLEVRDELASREIELVDPAQIAEHLRQRRIRNTAELTASEAQALADDLAAAYLVTGSIHRFVVSDELAELSIAAYLIYLPELRTDWVGSGIVQSGGPPTLFSPVTRSDTAQIVHRAVRQLLRDFDFSLASHSRSIVAVRSAGNEYPCTRIAVIPIANETSASFAGELLSDELRGALFRRGFDVLDPGRTREAMLRCGDLTRGLVNRAVLDELAELAHVQMVLTGSVSSITSAAGSRFGDVPDISVELRLVDVRAGEVIWAKAVHRRGDEKPGLFGMHVTLGASALAKDAARDVVRAIPVVREPVASNETRNLP